MAPDLRHLPAIAAAVASLACFCTLCCETEAVRMDSKSSTIRQNEKNKTGKNLPTNDCCTDQINPSSKPCVNPFLDDFVRGWINIDNERNVDRKKDSVYENPFLLERYMRLARETPPRVMLSCFESPCCVLFKHRALAEQWPLRP